jgi:hypothetical protein
VPASLLLERIAFAEDGPRRGYAVVTACTYDGIDGVQVAESQLPPLEVRRSRRSRWRYNFAGDGLLIRRWKEAPDAFGYVVFVTVTNRMEAALEVSAAASSVVETVAGAAGVAPVAGIGTAVSAVFKALKGIAGARVVGALVGSEVDAQGTDEDWSFRRREGKSFFTLSYDIDDDDDDNNNDSDDDAGLVADAGAPAAPPPPGEPEPG